MENHINTHGPFAKFIKVLSLSMLAVIVVFVIDLTSPLLLSGLTKSVYALFKTGAPLKDLPNEVSINLDGSTATFRKGESSYVQCINILRKRSAQDEELNPVPYPDFSHRQLCGNLQVRYLGLKFSFDIYRPETSANLFWIVVPHTSKSSGTTCITVPDDHQLGQFIRSHGEHK